MRGSKLFYLEFDQHHVTALDIFVTYNVPERIQPGRGLNPGWFSCYGFTSIPMIMYLPVLILCVREQLAATVWYIIVCVY